MFSDLVLGLVLPPAAAWFWLTLPPPLGITRSQFTYSWVCSAAAGLIASLLIRDWGMTACTTLSIALALAIWWWRRKGRKALRELGDKSRHRLAAIVSSLRERTQPRPGLRPVPQGAR